MLQLFLFDHNVSSLIAQGSEFPLKKPPGFHWDFFLLGITTFIAAFLGLPAPNGLIPQAPMHTSSLVIMGFQDQEQKHDYESNPVSPSRSGDQTLPASPTDEVRPSPFGNEKASVPVMRVEVPVSVVEQRVSNLAQGAACLVLMTGPFLKLLHWVPKGVLAGLFVSVRCSPFFAHRLGLTMSAK